MQVNHAAELKSFTAVGDSVLEQYAQPDKCAAGEKSPWECRTIPVRKLAEAGRLVWKRHAFCEQDLEELNQFFLVIAATDDPAVNDHIVQLCHERHIPVNHAGDQTQCDFQFPAIVQKRSGGDWCEREWERPWAGKARGGKAAGVELPEKNFKGAMPCLYLFL